MIRKNGANANSAIMDVWMGIIPNSTWLIKVPMTYSSTVVGKN